MTEFDPNRNPKDLPYRKTAECVLVYVKNGQLVAQDGKYFINLPGGGIDKGESVIKGAKRELKEEIAPKIKGLLKVILECKWDWPSEWADNDKRKKRYMQFRGEHVHFVFGYVSSFGKPTNVDNDAWTGKKTMSFKTAIQLQQKYNVLRENIPQFTDYNIAKLHVLQLVASLKK